MFPTWHDISDGVTDPANYLQNLENTIDQEGAELLISKTQQVGTFLFNLSVDH